MAFITTQLLFLFLLVYFGFNLLVLKLGNKYLEIANNWLRWVLFALLVASLASGSEPIATPHFWRLAFGAFFLWLLVETVFTWLTVAAFSRSDFPLFMRYLRNDEGDGRPVQRSFLLRHEWLRARGFHKELSLKAPIGGSFSLHSCIYLSDDRTIRLQIVFWPHRPARLQTSYVLSTRTREGEEVMTDNIDMPYGGYYPEHFFVERRPRVRSLEKLLAVHRRRLLHGGVNVEPWPQQDGGDLLAAINAQQKEIEALNVRNGFAVDRSQWETYGKLTSDGRYRLWKEIWLLKYLGRPLRAQPL